jgi:hypothetical protein
VNRGNRHIKGAVAQDTRLLGYIYIYIYIPYIYPRIHHHEIKKRKTLTDFVQIYRFGTRFGPTHRDLSAIGALSRLHPIGDRSALFVMSSTRFDRT